MGNNYFKKVISLFLLMVFLFNGTVINLSYAVETDGNASNWTYEKAEQLARRALFGPTQATIDQLYAAGSATDAVDVLFPTVSGPDRTQYDSDIEAFKTSIGFSSTSSNSNYKLYAYRLYMDPYEAKAKLFGLFEDIFPVQRNGTGVGKIDYPDIENHFSILNSETLGNYKEMIKKVFYNEENPIESFAMGNYLDLLNQGDKNNPNENYAREMMQLFMMLEYKPWEDAESEGAVRNYTEEDVAALAKIITGFRNGDDKVVYFDNDYHNTSTGITFLSGSLTSGDSFSFYDSENNLINNNLITQSIGGNNGLSDNIVDYIFSKRKNEIADFLAWRLYKFYINDYPTKEEIESVASILLANDFDIFPTVKSLLASDLMYSDKAMNSLRYKTPKELLIGTLKQIHYTNPGQMDNMLTKEWNLSKLGFTPYYPGSIFGRDGFDENINYFNAYFHNQWFSYFATRFIDDKYSSQYTFDFDDFIDEWLVNVTGSEQIVSNTLNTYSGSINLENINVTLEKDLVIGQQEVQVGTGTEIQDILTNSFTFSTGSINLDDLTILTNSGNIISFTGSLNFDNNTITGSTGSIIYFGTGVGITNINSQIKALSYLQRGITPDEYIDYLENNLLFGRKLPINVRQDIIYYLTHNSDDNEILFNPTNPTYRDKYLRASVGVVLSQPEHILQSGYDLSQDESGNSTNLFEQGKNSKLILVRMYGGYDWMNSIVPKDPEEYSYYQQIRGSGAIDTSNLIDIGDFYMNSYLEPFKGSLDNGDLTIFNRIGAPNHSRGHDSAGIQVTSQQALQSVGTPGLIGQLIKNDGNPLNNIVLGTSNPTIYTDGNYLNIGNDKILYNSYYSKDESGQIKLLKNTLTDRTYSGNSGKIFTDSVNLNGVGESGFSQVPSTISTKLDFISSLIDQDLGITYHVSAGGGFDTHNSASGDTYNSYLGSKINYLSSNIVEGFNKMKAAGQDVTIIVYTEFGRTLKTNGTNGTDHGQGSGYFLLTTNEKLKETIPDKVYGELTPSMEQENWFGVGIDYRAVYTKILESLYNIDTESYFGDYYDLDDYLNTDVPKPSLIRREYSNSYNGRVDLNVYMDVEDSNMILEDSSYMKVNKGYSTGSMGGVSSRWMNNYYIKNGKPRLYLDNFYHKTDYYFNVKMVDNQYDTYSFDYNITSPVHLGTSVNQIDFNYDSYLEKYNGTSVNNVTAISDLILLDNSGTGSVTKEFNSGIKMTFQTGSTFVDTLTSTDSLTWNGGFILPQEVNKDLFISSKAEYEGEKLTDLNVEKIIQVGADTLGVGMVLNNDVEITIPGVDNSKTYGIITSEDGLNWTLLSDPTLKISGTEVSFNTNHFSYFALVEVDSNFSCNLTANPSTLELGDSFQLTTSTTNVDSGSINNGVGNIGLNNSITITPQSSGEYTYEFSVLSGIATKVCTAVVNVLDVETDISGTGTTVDESIGDTTVGSGFTLIGEEKPTTVYKYSKNQISNLIKNSLVNKSGSSVAKLDLDESTNLYTTTGAVSFKSKYNTQSTKKITYSNKNYDLDDYVTIGGDETIILDTPATITFYNKGINNLIGYKKSSSSSWNYITVQSSECSVDYSNPICAYVNGSDIILKTLHFTDFAVLDVSSSSSSGGSSGSSSSYSGGSTVKAKVKDNCSNGDESGSYYDGTCYAKKEVAVISEKDSSTKEETTIKIDENKNTSEKNIDDYVETFEINGYKLKYIKGYKISNVVRNISFKIMNYSKISKEDRQFIIDKLGDFMVERYKIEVLKQKTKQNITNYKKSILLLKASFNRLKK